jgi:UDP-N-acetylmuramoylalanine--D-glutamate ligase
VSVVLNVSPNHIDRHGSLEAYARAKQPILTHQRPADVALLNHDCPIVSTWGGLSPGTTLFFSTRQRLETGVWVEGERVLARTPKLAPGERRGGRLDGPPVELFRRDALTLPGSHFLSDALAAAGAAALCGIPPTAIAERLASFHGLEHRLEFVRELNGVRYYNDSKATTAEAAIAALDAFDRPIVLIAGGSDKKLCYDAFGERICQRAKAVVLLGVTAPQVQQAIQDHGTVPTQTVTSLAAAVRAARALALPGDVVVLSPATASYDMFANFEERGATFKNLVRELPS